MPIKPKGCGRALGFKGIISKVEKEFLKYCCKVAELTVKDEQKLFIIKRKVERELHKSCHIISIIERIELIHLQ